jgi:DNA uptake protein ComE-like DNA-binding protein
MTNRTIRAATAILAVLLVPTHSPAEHAINVNTATEQELMKLPEMNEARAKAIVNYRATQGELIQLEELELIPQVKPIFPKLENHLVLE